LNQGFYREIVGWKHLSHPNILPFLGVSETLFQFSIITPWLSHGDILRYIRKNQEVNRWELVSDRCHLRGRTV